MIGPLPYIGGKRRLAPLIIRLMPSHTTYVEPFAGGCQVFFREPPSKVEVLNDIDDDLVNFLRVCQFHPDELVKTLGFLVASRTQFGRLSQQDPKLLTDIHRAARFFYLQKNSFGGRVARRNFHFCVTKPSNYNPARLPDLMRATADRLQRVQIECSDYRQVLLRYDRKTTLFYLDPPYVGLNLYRYNLADAEFSTLGESLRRLKGKFILSINDCALVRKLFADFEMKKVGTWYTSSRSVPFTEELLIANFPLPSDLDAPSDNERELSEGGSP